MGATAAGLLVNALNFWNRPDPARFEQPESIISSGIRRSSNALTAVNSALTAVTNYAATIGATQNRMTAASTFNSALSTNLESGVAGLVDANMNTASTQLQALQTQQQLGIQSLSIANQNAQLILKLFSNAQIPRAPLSLPPVSTPPKGARGSQTRDKRPGPRRAARGFCVEGHRERPRVKCPGCGDPGERRALYDCLDRHAPAGLAMTAQRTSSNSRRLRRIAPCRRGR